MSGDSGTVPAVTSPAVDVVSPVVATADENDDLYLDATRAEPVSAEEPAAARASTTEDESSAPHVSTSKEDASTTPTSPTSPTKNRFSGIFSKLKRRSKQNPEPGFIGGASFRNSESNRRSNQESPEGSEIPTHIPNLNDESARRRSDVSALSDDSERGRPIERTETEESKVSELSEYEEARDTFNENLAPPPSFGVDNARSAASPVRDSKFHEVL
jgi:hypothetical protein